MLVNTAVAQRAIDKIKGLSAKVLVSFPDPAFPYDDEDSLIVAPSVNYPDLLSFAVAPLNDIKRVRQTAVDVEQAKYLIDILQTWITAQQTPTAEKPRSRCGGFDSRLVSDE